MSSLCLPPGLREIVWKQMAVSSSMWLQTVLHLDEDVEVADCCDAQSTKFPWSSEAAGLHPTGREQVELGVSRAKDYFWADCTDRESSMLLRRAEQDFPSEQNTLQLQEIMNCECIVIAVLFCSGLCHSSVVKINCLHWLLQCSTSLILKTLTIHSLNA